MDECRNGAHFAVVRSSRRADELNHPARLRGHFRGRNGGERSPGVAVHTVFVADEIVVELILNFAKSTVEAKRAPSHDPS